MASKGYLGALLSPLATDLKRVLLPAFEHVVDTIRLGGESKALNFQWYRYSSTTAATANEEFSVVHGQAAIPTKLIPIVDLSEVGSQLVPLVVSRAPDDKRIYLKSSSTGAVITFYAEF